MDQVKETSAFKTYVVFGRRPPLRWPKAILAIAFMPSLEAALEKAERECPKGYVVVRVSLYDDLHPLLRFDAKMQFTFEFIGRALKTLIHINKLRARWGGIPRGGKVNFILSCVAELCFFGFIGAGLYFSFVARSFYGFLILGSLAMWVVMACVIPMVGAGRRCEHEKAGGEND